MVSILLRKISTTKTDLKKVESCFLTEVQTLFIGQICLVGSISFRLVDFVFLSTCLVIFLQKHIIYSYLTYVRTNGMYLK
jgi:hypothetical protein